MNGNVSLNDDFFASLCGEDKIYLKKNCKRPVESARPISAQESKVLSRIQKGENLGYNHVIWAVSGKCNPIILQRRYNEVLAKHEELRGAYFYKEMTEPVHVTYAKGVERFPITDLTVISEKKMIALIENLLAVRFRTEYDPEKSPLFSLQVFKTEEHRMIVLASYFGQFGSNLTTERITVEMFEGYTIENLYNNELTQDVVNINERVMEKSLDFWKNTLKDAGRELIVPGELRDGLYEGKESMTRSVPTDVCSKVTEYCDKNEVSRKSFWLYVWGKLLGLSNDEDNPLLMLTGNGERLKLFPVRVKCNGNSTDMLETDKVLEDYSNYTVCSLAEIGNEINVTLTERIHVAFSIVDFSGVSSLREFTESDNINLVGEIQSIRVPLQVYIKVSEESSSIEYTYDRGKFFEAGIGHLHQLIIDFAREYVEPKKSNPTEEQYLNLKNLSVKERRRILHEQKVLAIKNSGLFGTENEKVFDVIADKMTLRTYSCGEMIVSEKEAVSMVGILCGGNVEESRLREDGTGCSVKVLKPFECFLLEALSENNISPFDYSVSSESALVLWINPDALVDIFAVNPKSAIDFISRVNENMAKMKRLWTILD